MSRPGIWVSFTQIRPYLTDAEFRVLIDFKTRYEMASGFIGISTSDMSENLNQAYFALVRISFAWSAMERLSKVLPSNYHVKVNNEALSKALTKGDFDQLLVSLKTIAKELDHSGRYLNKYGLGKRHSNLADLARSIRNSVFHASLNPTRAGIARSKRRIAMLNGLADSILQGASTEFTHWVDVRLKAI